MLQRRLQSELKGKILEIQNGFTPGRGIQHCTAAVKALDDEFRHRKRLMYAAYLDLSKAYESVHRAILFKALREYYKVDPQLVDAIEALYQNNTGVVKMGNDTSRLFNLTTGVRQGCILSPLLFNAYLEHPHARDRKRVPGVWNQNGILQKLDG